jgi:hypothetical protein
VFTTTHRPTGSAAIQATGGGLFGALPGRLPRTLRNRSTPCSWPATRGGRIEDPGRLARVGLMPAVRHLDPDRSPARPHRLRRTHRARCGPAALPRARRQARRTAAGLLTRARQRAVDLRLRSGLLPENTTAAVRFPSGPGSLAVTPTHRVVDLALVIAAAATTTRRSLGPVFRLGRRHRLPHVPS